MKFEERKSEIIKRLNSTLSKDSTKEQIDNVKAIESELNEMSNIHNSSIKELEDVKTDYINLMKQSGNRDEKGSNTDSNDDNFDVNNEKSLENDMKAFFKK